MATATTEEEPTVTGMENSHGWNEIAVKAALETRFAELVNAYVGKINLYLAAEYMIDTLFDEAFELAEQLMDISKRV